MQNLFIFWYSYMITNFKFRVFLIIFLIKVKIYASIYISSFHFDYAMICIVVFINYTIWFINIHIFWDWFHVFINFVVPGSNKSYSSNKSQSLSTEYIIWQSWYHWFIIKCTSFYFLYLVCFTAWLQSCSLDCTLIMKA